MQFQVPQFIETEDRIVGPLTLKQFIYVGSAAGLSVLLFFTVGRTLWIILSVFLLGIGISLALVKVNGQPLVKVLAAALNFYWRPQTYVWQPDHPALPKTTATMKSAVGSGFSLENMIMGLALKKARESVETGNQVSVERVQHVRDETRDRYQVYQGILGERKAARRVDYR